MDEMVLRVQRWVNQEYSHLPGFNERVPENGKVGWSTIYGLTRALQLELGITNTANSFGPTTAKEYNRFGILELGKVPDTDQAKNIVMILQAAMYCKGYNPTGFTGTFGEGTKAAIINLQTDAGLPVRDGKVYDYVFKAFLIMDAFKLTLGGDQKIREIQQALNYSYYQTAGVQPTDGHYQRNTNKALIYGIQTEIGIVPDNQTGSVGPATTAGLPTLMNGSKGNFVKLFQYAMYVNNHPPGDFDGIFGASVKNAVMDFQKFVGLTADGIVGKQTWLSLLISTGDPSRKGTACDCITEVTLERGKALKAAGYETVGRYLTNVSGGINKKLQPGELKNIFDAGLSVFPIYQTYGAQASSFSAKQGGLDAKAAYDAAKNYGFQDGTTIYFAVDFDAYGTDITDKILPHFDAINKKMVQLGGSYKVGVYGPRSVCIQVSEKGYAKTSFVSGMSTGFSGNLGYPLPKNWAFDQISTIKVGSGSGAIEIDNNIKSGRDTGVTKTEIDKLPFTLQLAEMASNAYEDNLQVGFESLGNWTLYKIDTNSFTSFDVHVYRKEIYAGKYAYTVAFRGSQEWKDFVVDITQVMLNMGGLQIDDAVDYVRELIQTDSEMMSHMYITGHSLGGYLAQYVQSEMIDENLPWVESNTVTFSAPGFKPGISFVDIAHSAKVTLKLANDKLKKYDDLIVNHRINLDIISFFGDDLGTVYTYSAGLESMNPVYYHSLDRFKEVNLK